MTIKTYVVPAFFLVEAESVERADEIACNVAETTNNLPHGHGHASLRLDECLGTLEAPEDFPGESLLTEAQLGEVLHLAPGTLRNQRRRLGIPVILRGKTPLFAAQDVADYLERIRTAARAA